MSEVTEVTPKNRVAKLLSFAPHWGALDRGLRFLLLAKQLATPTYTGMACGACAVSIALALAVNPVCWVFAVPLSIIAATLIGGVAVNSRRHHRRRRKQRH